MRADMRVASVPRSLPMWLGLAALCACALLANVGAQETLLRFDCKMGLTWIENQKRYAFKSDDVTVLTACSYDEYMWHHVIVSINETGYGSLFVDGVQQELVNEDLTPYSGGNTFQTDTYPIKQGAASASERRRMQLFGPGPDVYEADTPYVEAAEGDLAFESCSFKLGMGCDADFLQFDGIMDEVAVWNRALEPEEVADAMFKMPSHLPHRPLESPNDEGQVDISSGRLLWARFNDPCGTAAVSADSSGLSAGITDGASYSVDEANDDVLFPSFPATRLIFTGVPWAPPEITAAPSSIPMDGGVEVTLQGVGFARSPFSHCTLLHPNPVGDASSVTASASATLELDYTSETGRPKYIYHGANGVTYSHASVPIANTSITANRFGEVPDYYYYYQNGASPVNESEATTPPTDAFLAGWFDEIVCEVPLASFLADGYKLSVSNDGGMTVGSVQTTSVHEYSVDFDGTVGLTGSGDSPTSISSFTLSFWVYPKQNVVSSTLVSLGVDSIPLGLYFENGLLVLRDSPTGAAGTGLTTLTLEAWHHVALVVDGENAISARLDGVLFYGPTPIRFNQFGQEIGIKAVGTGFVGYLDELKLYDEPVTDMSKAFVRELAHENLVSYYRFNGNLKQEVGSEDPSGDLQASGTMTYATHHAPWEATTLFSVDSHAVQSGIRSIDGATIEVTGHNFAPSKFLECKFGSMPYADATVLAQYDGTTQSQCLGGDGAAVGEGTLLRNDGQNVSTYYFPRFVMSGDVFTSPATVVSEDKVTCNAPDGVTITDRTLTSFSVGTSLTLNTLDVDIGGQSLQCDGVGDYAEFPSIVPTAGLNAYTVSLWVYPSVLPHPGSVADAVTVWVFENDDTHAVDGAVKYDGEKFIYYDDKILSVVSTTMAAPSMWHNVVLSVDEDGEGKMFVDCTLSATFTTAAAPMLGSKGRLCASFAKPSYDGTYAFFHGIVDELKVSQSAVAEVACPLTIVADVGYFQMTTESNQLTDTVITSRQSDANNGNMLKYDAECQPGNGDCSQTNITTVRTSSPWLAPKWPKYEGTTSAAYLTLADLGISAFAELFAESGSSGTIMDLPYRFFGEAEATSIDTIAEYASLCDVGDFGYRSIPTIEGRYHCMAGSSVVGASNVLNFAAGIRKDAIEAFNEGLTITGGYNFASTASFAVLSNATDMTYSTGPSSGSGQEFESVNVNLGGFCGERYAIQFQNAIGVTSEEYVFEFAVDESRLLNSNINNLVVTGQYRFQGGSATEKDRNLVENRAMALPFQVAAPTYDAAALKSAGTVCVSFILDHSDAVPVFTGAWKAVCYVTASDQVYLNGYVVTGVSEEFYGGLMRSFIESGTAFGTYGGAIDEIVLYAQPLEACEIEARYYTTAYALKTSAAAYSPETYGEVTLGNAFTIGAWIYPTSVDGQYALVSTAEDDVLAFTITDGNLGISVKASECDCSPCSNYIDFVSDKARVLPKQWSHVAVSCDGTNCALIVDGVQREVKQIEQAFSVDTRTYVIANKVATVSPAYEAFQGYVHSVSIATKARTAYQVKQYAECWKQDHTNTLDFTPGYYTPQVTEHASLSSATSVVNMSTPAEVDYAMTSIQVVNDGVIQRGDTLLLSLTARSICGTKMLYGGEAFEVTIVSIDDEGDQVTVELSDTNDGNYHGDVDTSGMLCGTYEIRVSPGDVMMQIAVTAGPASPAMSVLTVDGNSCFGIERTITVAAKDTYGCTTLDSSNAELQFHANVVGPYDDTVTLTYQGSGTYQGTFLPKTPGPYLFTGSLTNTTDGTSAALASTYCIDVCTGGSAQFSGITTAEFAEVVQDGSNSTDLDLSFDAITMEMWTNAGFGLNKVSYLIIKGDPAYASSKGYSIYLDALVTTVTAEVYVGMGEYRKVSASFQKQRWFHIAAVYDGTSFVMYGDGEILAVETFEEKKTSHANVYEHSLLVGEDYLGFIDEIRLWKVARTQEQIIAAMYCPPYNDFEDIAAYITFNEGGVTGTANRVQGPGYTTSSTPTSTDVTSFDASPFDTNDVGMNGISKTNTVVKTGAPLTSGQSTVTIEAFDHCGFRYTAPSSLSSPFAFAVTPITVEDESSGMAPAGSEYPLHVDGDEYESSPVTYSAFVCKSGDRIDSISMYTATVDAQEAGLARMEVNLTSEVIVNAVVEVLPGVPMALDITRQPSLTSGMLGTIHFSVFDEFMNVVKHEHTIDVAFLLEGSTDLLNFPYSVKFDDGTYMVYFVPPFSGFYTITLAAQGYETASKAILVSVLPGSSVPVVSANPTQVQTGLFEHAAVQHGSDLVIFGGASMNGSDYTNEVIALTNYDFSSLDILTYQRHLTVSGVQILDKTISIIVDTAALIESGKLQDSCEDMYFAPHGSPQTRLLHYVSPYPGCGSANTTIHIRITGDDGQLMIGGPFLSTESGEHDVLDAFTSSGEGGVVDIDMFYGGRHEPAQDPSAFFTHHYDFETAIAGPLSTLCESGQSSASISNDLSLSGDSSLKIESSSLEGTVKLSTQYLFTYHVQAFMYDSGMTESASHFLAINSLYGADDCAGDLSLTASLSTIGLGINTGCHPTKYCVYDSSWTSTAVERSVHWVALEMMCDGTDLVVYIDGTEVLRRDALPLTALLLVAGMTDNQKATTYWDEISVKDEIVLPTHAMTVFDRAAYFSPQSTWAEVPTTGRKPAPRMGHTSTMVSSDVMAVFGGERSAYIFNDLWLLDLSTMAWTHPVITAESTPQARYDHVAFAHKGKLYVQGGLSYDGNVLDDMWCFDPAESTWTEYDFSNTTGRYEVPATLGHSVAEVNGVFYLFGGYSSAGGESASLVSFDLEANVLATLPSPSLMAARFAHSAFVSQGVIYVSGGNDLMNAQKGGLWGYDVLKGAWGFTAVDGSVACEHVTQAVTGGFIMHGGSCGEASTTVSLCPL